MVNTNIKWRIRASARARIPTFKTGPRLYCRAKGTKEAKGLKCKSKCIGKGRHGKPGLYYVFCLADHGCSCQSIYPKMLRIPLPKLKGR